MLQESEGLGQSTGLEQGPGLSLPPEMARERAMQLAQQASKARQARTEQGSNVLGVTGGALGAIIGAFGGNPMLGYQIGSAAGRGAGQLVGGNPKEAAGSFVSAVTGGTDLAKMFNKKKQAAAAPNPAEGADASVPFDSPLGPENGTMTVGG